MLKNSHVPGEMIIQVPLVMIVSHGTSAANEAMTESAYALGLKMDTIQFWIHY
jgi:hypothetical protein